MTTDFSSQRLYDSISLVPRVGRVLRRLGLLDSVEVSWVEKVYQGFSEENPGWRESRRALGEMAGLCRQQGCRFVVAIYPLLVDLINAGEIGKATNTAVAELGYLLGGDILLGVVGAFVGAGGFTFVEALNETFHMPR